MVSFAVGGGNHKKSEIFNWIINNKDAFNYWRYFSCPFTNCILIKKAEFVNSIMKF